jgi:2-phosphosulfolactate phosphatase
MVSYFNQTEYESRCEWGIQGITHLLPDSDVLIIVDVMSFCTCVDIAVSRGAAIYPYQWRDERAAEYARSLGALLANPDRRAQNQLTLSPSSLLNIPAGTHLVLPSPNGSTLSSIAGNTPTFAGSLRNAEAVARAAQQVGQRISVIPAGERWSDASLRPSLEDWLGAGAILYFLDGHKSPEAQATVSLFQHFQSNLPAVLRDCASGRELRGEGFAEDVELASAFNVSSSAPYLSQAGYTSTFQHDTN